MSRTTVIVTLWGRPWHSLRWMWHANRTHFPHKILLADGGNETWLEPILRNRSLFPNLDYEYLRYNDHCVDAYYQKVIETAERVTTPYILLCDNDDFVLPGALEWAADALDQDKGLVGAGARILTFSVATSYPPQPMELVAGSLGAWVLGGTYETVGDSTSLGRIERVFNRKIYSAYYHLVRRETFLEVWRDLRASGITSLDIAIGEFVACGVVARGRVLTDPSRIIHLRQLATSSVGGQLASVADRLADPKWQGDVQRMADALGRIVAQQDGMGANEAAACVRDMMLEKRRPKPTQGKAQSSALRRIARTVVHRAGARSVVLWLRARRALAASARTSAETLAQVADALHTSGGLPDAVGATIDELKVVQASVSAPALKAFINEQAGRTIEP